MYLNPHKNIIIEGLQSYLNRNNIYFVSKSNKINQNVRRIAYLIRFCSSGPQAHA